MGLFRGKKSRQIVTEPLPDWDDTRWRSHLRANALGTEHHCGIYVQMINDDRKEAARLFKNDDTDRARNYAESALRHNRTVTALAALSPLSNALYQRAEPLAGYTSLVQIPEPARSGIVTIVFAAGRLHMNYLSETVQFLREQFGSVHVDAIQKGEGELYALVNPTVRDALSPAPATRDDIDAELASAVKQYFGISVPAGAARSNRSKTAGNSDVSPTASLPEPVPVPPNETRRSQTTPLSAVSSDAGAPVSPQISETRRTEEAKRTSQRSRMYASANPPTRYHSTAASASTSVSYQNADQHVLYSNTRSTITVTGDNVERSDLVKAAEDALSPQLANEVSAAVTTSIPSAGHGESEIPKSPVREFGRDAVQPELRLPEHLRGFEDSDEMLLARYDHLCAVICT